MCVTQLVLFIGWQWTKAVHQFQESSTELTSALFPRQQANLEKKKAVTVRGLALISPLFCSHLSISCLFFSFLSFVCRSMPMLEKLSMPLAVRLAGITNCHVFVHALRTIKVKVIIFTEQFTCNYTYTLEARKFTLKSDQHFSPPPLLLEHVSVKYRQHKAWNTWPSQHSGWTCSVSSSVSRCS